jgi:ATP-dependent DNA helicase RecQ
MNPGPAATPEEVLRRRWGFAAFRPFQREAAAAALSGRDCLVVLPTGGGKSLCYQLPAAAGRGLVLVISPLIALMDDQVAAARRVGIPAQALHSGLPDARRREVLRGLACGDIRLLYLSPERFLAGDRIPRLRERLALVAVDEAHCISHWGHEFRPDYRRLGPALELLPRAARMALTATAGPAVQDDICAQLGLRRPERLVAPPDRPNLLYRVRPRRERLAQVLEVARRHEGEAGIVYVRRRADAERLAGELLREGLSCAAYHAGLPAQERAHVHQEFSRGRLDVVAATVAFGMGIDRADIRYVVHAGAPASLEGYQQESGRAGHDGKPAECVLLFSAADLAAHRRLAAADRSLSRERRRALSSQRHAMARYAGSWTCRHRSLCAHAGAGYEPKDCGACDVCLRDRSLIDALRLRAEGLLACLVAL